MYMKLTKRERDIIEAIATISKQDIPMKQLSSMLGISYPVLIRHKKEAMRKNGYSSWDGFLADFVREELTEEVN